MYILRYRGTQHRPLDKNAAMALGRRPTAVLQSSSKGLCWKLPNSHTRPHWAALVCAAPSKSCSLDAVECDLSR